MHTRSPSKFFIDSLLQGLLLLTNSAKAYTVTPVTTYIYGTRGSFYLVLCPKTNNKIDYHYYT